uniref:NB-ARC domain-containing protein n=1 Tax=Leersia perrieri TaxID=77586 RepID=A0A0D9W523_9ORYZ
MNVPWKTFDQAVQRILDYFVDNQRDTRVIYFDGWRGFGASAVLRAVADQLASPEACLELRLDKVIHIDCSTWKSPRAMQRAIAVELKLDSVMEFLDEADEEDDLNGVDEGSRGEIMSITDVIDRTLRDQRLLFIFHNGSGDYIYPINFGIPQLGIIHGHFVLWTFRRRFEGTGDYSKIKNKVKNTQLFAYETSYDIAINELLFPVLQKEATAIAANHLCMREINQERRIVHCCLYELFLYLCLPKNLENDGAARASAYWMCDDNIQHDQLWEISSALSKEIKWGLEASLLDEVWRGPIESSTENSICCQRFKDTDFGGHHMSYPWITITASGILESHHLGSKTEGASSYLIAPERLNAPLVLADGLFDQLDNLQVLQLSYCFFCFASPPFIDCKNIRFLGLYHCENNITCKQSDLRKWQFLRSLLVLDLIYTCWYEVLSKCITDLFVNLRELNIVGVDWSCIWSQQQHKKEYVDSSEVVVVPTILPSKIGSTCTCAAAAAPVLPVWVSSFPNLKTLHVIHRSNLRNIFVLDGDYPSYITVHGVAFPKLTTIHLHNLPSLRQICDVEFKMVAPALERMLEPAPAAHRHCSWIKADRRDRQGRVINLGLRRRDLIGDE